jgi:hypothetical protein
VPSSSQHYPYNGYYRNTLPGSAPHQPYNARTSSVGRFDSQLQWQQPYVGPRPGSSTPSEHHLSHISHGSGDDRCTTYQTSSTATNDARTAPSVPSWRQSSDPNVPQSLTQNLPAQNHASQQQSSSWAHNGVLNLEQSMNEISKLSTLQPSQIASILQANPELRDAVWAAVDKHRTGSS